MDKLKKKNICCICLDLQSSFAPIPCGHLSLCKNCYKIIGNFCPICNKKINTFLKIYIV